MASLAGAKAAESLDLAEAARAEASRHVAETRAATAATFAQADSASALLGLSRFYKVGDRWVVAVSHVSHGMVRMTDGGKARRDRFLDPVFYEFRVVALGPGEVAARVEVTQVGADGGEIRTGRVPKAAITVDRKMKIVSKEYFYRDLAVPVVAEFGSAQNVPMGFDAFPLELPDLARSRATGAQDAAAGIPAPLKGPASRRTLDSANTIRFESSDLFSRAVRVTWQKGDLWPAYVETPAGHSVLILMEKK